VLGGGGRGWAVDAALGRADVVHIHGLWTIPGWMAARRARCAGVPVIISPRGMLDPGSLAQRGVRKRIAYALIERRNLRHAALLHATSETEARAPEARAPAAPAAVIPTGAVAPARLPHPPGDV